MNKMATCGLFCAILLFIMYSYCGVYDRFTLNQIIMMAAALIGIFACLSHVEK